MYVMNQYATSIARSVNGGTSFTNIGGGLPTGAACFNLRFGVHPNDPFVLGAIPCILLGVAVLATSVPAWRASKVEPLTALRMD